MEGGVAVSLEALARKSKQSEFKYYASVMKDKSGSHGNAVARSLNCGPDDMTRSWAQFHSRMNLKKK